MTTELEHYKRLEAQAQRKIIELQKIIQNGHEQICCMGDKAGRKKDKCEHCSGKRDTENSTTAGDS
jgi:hypothetical protein